MALSATFVAKFDAFYGAVDKANTKLDEFKFNADSVGARLEGMQAKFRGDRVVAEAVLMQKAIENIGGVANLTEKELQEVANKATEAVAKMKAIGVDAPKGLVDLANAAKPAAENVAKVNFSVMDLAKTFGLGFGIQQVVSKMISFGKEILADADALMKMHDITGVTLQRLQQFQVAADDAGNSIDDVTSAITKMEDLLKNQDKAALKALEDLKIPFEDIKNLKPENQFIAISDAIRQVKDPAQQVQLAIDLFGKQGAQLLPTLKRGFDDVKDSAVGMSDDTIENLDLVGDTMGRWYRTTKGALADGIVEFARFVKDGADPTTHALQNMVREAEALNRQIKEMTANIPAAPKAAPAQLPKISIDSAEVKAGLADLKAANDDINASNDKVRKKTEEAQKAIDDYNASLKRIGDTLSGGGVIDKANDYVVALRNTVPLAQMTRTAQDDVNKVMGDAIAAFEALGQTATEEMYRVYIATKKPIPEIQNFSDAVKYLGTEQMPLFATQTVSAMGQAVTGTKGLERAGSDLESSLKGTLKGIPNTIIAAFTGGGGMTGAIAAIGVQLGQDFADALDKSIQDTMRKNKANGTTNSILTAANIGMAGGAGALSGVGAMAGGATVGQSIGSVAMTGASVAMMGGLTSASIALGAATMGIGTAAVLAYYGIKKWMDSIKERKATNQAREDYIDLAGGLDALNVAAWKAGATLDDLLAAKNTDEAKAAIDGLNEAFQFQQASLELVTATAEKYGFTLEELGPALQRSDLDKQAQTLFQDFEVLNAAGIDSTAIMLRMGDAASDYLQKAIKFGVEVPEAMRPMLEDMAKAGDLTDANGDKMTDLEAAGVKFSFTMSEGFTRLIGAVDKLADVISRSLGVALDDTASKINQIPKNVDVEVRYKQTVTGQAPNMEQPESVEGFASGTNGFRNFGAGTPVILHGWEAVIPRGSKSQAGAGLSAEGGTTIVINAQGAFFDTPGSLQQLADRVDAALSARHGLKNKRRAA